MQVYEAFIYLLEVMLQFDGAVPIAWGKLYFVHFLCIC